LGLVKFSTGRILGSTRITIGAAMLDSAGNIADTTQFISGGLSVNVNVASSHTAAGTISPSTVTIPGGSNFGYTFFQPQGIGTSTITVDTPAGFSTPAQFTAATADVIQ